jgi:hypothetical protein
MVNPSVREDDCFLSPQVGQVSFLLNKKVLVGSLECKMVTTQKNCFLSQVGQVSFLHRKNIEVIIVRSGSC